MASGSNALEKNDFREFERPARLIFGKSLVGGSKTDDVFNGIVPGPIPFVAASVSAGKKHVGLSLELGGPWNFYNEFWRAHNLEHLADLLPVSEMALRLDVGYVHIPLLIGNGTDTPEEVTIAADLPEGWSDKGCYTTYPVRPGEVYPVRVLLAPADASEPGWHEIT